MNKELSKETYNESRLEIISFGSLDVITTSNAGSGSIDGDAWDEN